MYILSSFGEKSYLPHHFTGIFWFLIESLNCLDNIELFLKILCVTSTARIWGFPLLGVLLFLSSSVSCSLCWRTSCSHFFRKGGKFSEFSDVPSVIFPPWVVWLGVELVKFW